MRGGGLAAGAHAVEGGAAHVDLFEGFSELALLGACQSRLLRGSGRGGAGTCPRLGFLRHSVTCVIQGPDLGESVTQRGWGASLPRHLRHGGVTQATHDDADGSTLRHALSDWSGAVFRRV